MMIGRRQIYPVLLPFPIWRYGAIYDFDGRYVRDGWFPSRYSEREVAEPPCTMQIQRDLALGPGA